MVCRNRGEAFFKLQESPWSYGECAKALKRASSTSSLSICSAAEAPPRSYTLRRVASYQKRRGGAVVDAR